VSGFGHLSSIVEIARFELQNFTVQAKELAQRLVWSLPGLSCTSISHRDSCRAHHKLMLPMAKYSARSCPRCDGYLGTALREPERNTRRQAVNGHCVRWSCRMAWIVIEGDGPKNKRTDSHGSVPNIIGYTSLWRRDSRQICAPSPGEEQRGKSRRSPAEKIASLFRSSLADRRSKSQIGKMDKWRRQFRRSMDMANGAEIPVVLFHRPSNSKI
jgi:hypothetical protein